MRKDQSLVAEAIVLGIDMATFFGLWLAADIEWWWAALISTIVVHGSWWLTKKKLQNK